MEREWKRPIVLHVCAINSSYDIIIVSLNVFIILHVSPVETQMTVISDSARCHTPIVHRVTITPEKLWNSIILSAKWNVRDSQSTFQWTDTRGHGKKAISSYKYLLHDCDLSLLKNVEF